MSSGFGLIGLRLSCRGGRAATPIRTLASGPVLVLHRMLRTCAHPPHAVHNVGLAHATRITCDATGKCAKDEYGDFMDPMGSGGSPSGPICLSAPQVRAAAPLLAACCHQDI